MFVPDSSWNLCLGLFERNQPGLGRVCGGTGEMLCSNFSLCRLPQAGGEGGAYGSRGQRTEKQASVWCEGVSCQRGSLGLGQTDQQEGALHSGSYVSWGGTALHGG